MTSPAVFYYLSQAADIPSDPVCYILKPARCFVNTSLIISCIYSVFSGFSRFTKAKYSPIANPALTISAMSCDAMTPL